MCLAVEALLVIMVHDVLVLSTATLFTGFVGCWIVSFHVGLSPQENEYIM